MVGTPVGAMAAGVLVPLSAAVVVMSAQEPDLQLPQAMPVDREIASICSPRARHSFSYSAHTGLNRSGSQLGLTFSWKQGRAEGNWYQAKFLFGHSFVVHIRSRATAGAKAFVSPLYRGGG